MGSGDSLPISRPPHSVGLWLTEDNVAGPAWSPDGRFVAAWSIEEGPRDLWLFDVNTGDGWALTRDDAIDGEPDWLSEDHIVFPSNRSGPMGLFIVQIDSAGRAVGDPEPLAVPAIRATSPSVSIEAHRRVYANDSMTGNLARLAIGSDGWPVLPPEDLTMGENQLVEPEVSPDGRHVVARRFFPPQAIVVFEIASGRVTVLTEFEGELRRPSWTPDSGLRTPDSEWVIFGRLPLGHGQGQAYELWIARIDGTGLQRVEGLVGPAAYGAWSPDGAWLLATGTASWQLYPRQAPGSGWAAVEPVSIGDVDCGGGAFLIGSWIDARHQVGSCAGQPAVLDVESLSVRRMEPPEVWPRRETYHCPWLVDAEWQLWRWEIGDSEASGPRPFPEFVSWTSQSLSMPASGSHLYYSQLDWEGDVWMTELSN